MSGITIPTCSKCGSNMRRQERKSDGQPFWGCSSFPRCKNIQSFTAEEKKADEGGRTQTAFDKPSSYSGGRRAPIERKALPPIQGSDQQLAFWSAIKNSPCHLVLGALAGTGKTTSCVYGILEVPGLKCGLTCFNKHIKDEAQSKMPEGSKAVTMNALGYATICAAYGRVKLDEHKISSLLDEILTPDEMENQTLRACVGSLVDHVRGYLADPTDTQMLDWLLERHDISVPEPTDEMSLEQQMNRIYALVPTVVKLCRERAKQVIDFNDQIWIPIVDKLPVEQFDILFVDEAQDLNAAKQALMMKAALQGRIVVVGDRHQAIYGFTGADTKSMETMENMLRATPRGVEVFPLTKTRRCGKAIVRLAQHIVPTYEYFEDAPEGVVECLTELRAMEEIKPGDMAICRVNAPLVKYCLMKIRDGVKAVIRGRDFGQELVNLVRKLKPADLDDLAVKLHEWERKETARLHAKGASEASIINVEDKVATIEVLMEDASNLTELRATIEEIFREFTEDGKPKQAIVFSSIHKAKGLESDTVFILQPELLPHPMADRPEEMVQERNLGYVAATRAKTRLVFVGDIPPMLGGAEKTAALPGSEEGETEEDVNLNLEALEVDI